MKIHIYFRRLHTDNNNSNLRENTRTIFIYSVVDKIFDFNL